MENKLKWNLFKFKDLDVELLYDIIWLRNEVFVVEQNCVFQDADYKDKDSFHLIGSRHEKLIAYCRICPPGIYYKDKSAIGRVIIHPDFRSLGYGKELIQNGIIQSKKLFYNDIKIGAQSRLLKFYSDLGFVPIGEKYIEDGIEHIHMIYKI